MFDLLLQTAAQGLGWLWLVLFAFQAVLAAIGQLAGTRFSTEATARAEATGLVTTGVLGLTAFVLALTLSFSTGRMSERRAGALEEANALGTAWLQAGALADPQAQVIAALLKDYALSRHAFVQAEFAAPELPALSAETDRLQAAIWAEMTGLLARRTDPHTVSLMNAINHVFDTTTSERLSLARGLPPRLVHLLLLMVGVSAAMAGFQLGLKRQRAPVLVGVLIALWSAVILIVLDFSAARLGSFRTVLEPYVWTLQGMGVPITP